MAGASAAPFIGSPLMACSTSRMPRAKPSISWRGGCITTSTNQPA